MSHLTERLRRDLREVAAGAHPSPTAWDSIAARLGDDAEPEVELVLARTPTAPKRAVFRAAVAAALVVIAGSVAVLTRPDDDRSVTTADLNLTTTFASARNGFSVNFDDGLGSVTPAKQIWSFSEQVDDGFDVIDTGAAAVFKGASTELRDQNVASLDEQIDDYLSDNFPGGCGVPRTEQEEITIDGRVGRIAECSQRIDATVVAGGRLYLFTLVHERSDARAVFDAIVATIDLIPETAVDVPAMTTTFVSPTYGYSFKHLDRGGLVPATERWDPVSEQLDVDFDKRFDAVETGMAAYFEAASTPIPGDVSIDDWADQYVTPLAAGGCGVPRSEQEEGTIDGQPARISECENGIQATVVAGGRLYLFILSADRRDARAFFDAWTRTIDLTPETAAVP